MKRPFVYECISGKETEIINDYGTPFDEDGFTLVNNKRYHANAIRYEFKEETKMDRELNERVDSKVKSLLKTYDKEKIDDIINHCTVEEIPLVIKQIAARFNLIHIVKDKIWTNIALQNHPVDNGDGTYPYPEEIMENVREALGLEPDDESRDDEIRGMSKLDILDKVATWEGLIGYGGTIMSWVQDIWNINLDSLEEEV